MNSKTFLSSNLCVIGKKDGGIGIHVSLKALVSCPFPIHLLKPLMSKVFPRHILLRLNEGLFSSLASRSSVFTKYLDFKVCVIWVN